MTIELLRSHASSFCLQAPSVSMIPRHGCDTVATPRNGGPARSAQPGDATIGRIGRDRTTMSEDVTTSTVTVGGYSGGEIEAYLAVPDDGAAARGSVVVIHHMPGYDTSTRRSSGSSLRTGMRRWKPGKS